MEINNNKKLISPFWEQIDGDKFKNRPISDEYKPADGIMDCSLPQYELVRNAQINFKIKVLNSPHGFHAAVLFRKNNSKYLGAGLGGWNSYYSVFNRTLEGFVQRPIGTENDIQTGQEYNFYLEFIGGFLVTFKKDSETLFPFQDFSFRDSLGSTMRISSIGLYANGQTMTEITLNVKELPTRCFIITNIDGENGKETDERRKKFEDILKQENVDNIEFYDSRDLIRELPMMIKIKEGIVQSDLVIVDLGCGKPRPNVYYELGIAHSIGIPVIHVGPREDEFKNKDIIPSDLRHQFFILEHELESELAKTFNKILDKPAGRFEYI